MSYEFLQTLWFILIAVLWIGFFFLEGFDFGVGMLLPFLGKKDKERRAIINKEKNTQVWISDLVGIIPSITGKIELVYEGEQEGSDFVAQRLIAESSKTLFLKNFPKHLPG